MKQALGHDDTPINLVIDGFNLPPTVCGDLALEFRSTAGPCSLFLTDEYRSQMLKLYPSVYIL
jgi:hypothetical protein